MPNKILIYYILIIKNIVLILIKHWNLVIKYKYAHITFIIFININITYEYTHYNVVLLIAL